MTRSLFVIALLTLAGCGLDRPYPDKSYYVLEAAAGDGSTSSANPTLVIRVPRADVAPPFSSRALQYRVAANRYEPSYYHSWADDPGALVAAAARETMAATGAFVVLAAGSNAAGAATVELYVSSLYVDVTTRTPRVVLSLRATMVDEDGAVLVSRQFESAEPTTTSDAADAVRAFNTALQTILDELSTEVRQGRS